VRIALVAVAGAMLYGAAAQAQMSPVQPREPRPGSSALAATGNIVFMPVRVAVTSVGAVLGGVTGWLTAGNVDAANDIWHLPPFDGNMYLQPEMMYGGEPVRFGQYEFHMRLTDR